MKGWGSVSLFLALGVFMSAGCGGRTGALYEDGYEPNEQAGNSSGGAGTAGRPGRAGARNTGGAGPIPTGGVSSFGGTAGAYSGGAYTGGTGFGGFAFGGTTGVAGSFVTGGSAGFPSNDCQTCIFETCGATLSQCLQDFGCISILACTQATGCDAFQCYNPQTCGPVIDQWGGPGGPSMSMLHKSFSCVVMSGCPCN